MFDLPRDADILNDLRALELIDGIIKLASLRIQDTKDAEFKRHGDGAIMLALAHYATRQDAGPVWVGSKPIIHNDSFKGFSTRSSKDILAGYH